MHLVAWSTLSLRFHKADLLESFYIGAEEYRRLLSDIEIDMLNRRVERPVKPFRKARPSDLLIEAPIATKNWGWARYLLILTPIAYSVIRCIVEL